MKKIYLIDQIVFDKDKKEIFASDLRHGGRTIHDIIFETFSKEYKIEVFKKLDLSRLKNKDSFIIWPLNLYPIDITELKEIFYRSKHSLFDLYIDPHNEINNKLKQKIEDLTSIFIKSSYQYKTNSEALKIKTKSLFKFKTESSFFALRSASPTSRIFNKLNLKDGWFEKESSKTEKIASEYNYINNLPNHLKKFFPKISPNGINRKKNSSSYLIEYLPGEDCANIAISNKFNDIQIQKLHTFIFQWLSNVEKYKLEEGKFNIFLEEKCKERLSQLKKQKIKNKLDSLAEFFDLPNTDAILTNLIRMINKNKMEINSKPLGFFHGDLCLSNIIFSNENYYLIDPRGLNNNRPTVNLLYEFAKLRHSILSRYDILNMDLGTYQISNDRRLTIMQDENKSYMLLENLYFELLDNFSLSDELIRLIEASLFFSMMPLHCEKSSKVLSFYLQTISLLDDIY